METVCLSTFNPHYLVRQIPAGTWQSYLAARGITAEDLDWSLEPKSLASAVAALLDGLERTQQANIHAELQRLGAVPQGRACSASPESSVTGLRPLRRWIRIGTERVNRPSMVSTIPGAPIC